MPINNGAYENPNWINNTSPYIDADEMNAISETLENVPVANGGTGKQTQNANSVLVGNGTGALKNVDSANGALYATGSGQLPQFGILPVAQGGTGQTSEMAFRSAMGLGNTTGALPVANGGTGKATHTSNAVLTGDGTNPVKNVATASGALYATGANQAAQFGVLPVAQGGTGATTAAAARNNLGLGNTSGALPIANGGTGASTVAAARNNLGLGNTSGAVPVANGGTGMTGRISESLYLPPDVMICHGISSGTAYRWGNVVTVIINTERLHSNESVLGTNCIPEGYRPSGTVWVVFGGTNHSSTDYSESRYTMTGHITSGGSLIAYPNSDAPYVWYHATVTYLIA